MVVSMAEESSWRLRLASNVGGNMNILVAIEGSSFSDKALEWAADYAKAKSANLTAVVVAEEIGTFDEALPDMVDIVRATLLNEAKATAERAKASANKLGVALEVIVISGMMAAEAIIDQAQSKHADLLVLGSRGRKGLNRFVMGSVASRVVRHAPCTTTVVR